MNRLLAVSTAAWLAAVAAGGCGGAAPAVPVPPPPGSAASQPPTPLIVSAPYFRPGEQMSWELALHGIFGGQAVLVVGEPAVVDGHNVVAVHSQTETAGAVKVIKEVRDDITTWIDLDTTRPIRLTGELKFGEKEIRIDTVFTATGFESVYQKGDQRPRTVRRTVPTAFTYDTHSLIGVLRAWDPEPGTRAYFYAVAGRRLWHNSIRFVGRELHRTRLGLSPTLRFEGVATRVNSRLIPERHKKPRSFTVWFSDDARRVPLLLLARTEYGEVTAELTSYTPGPLVSAR